MKQILKYRLIGFTLALIFGVFNVGLPIVVASCPMMKYENSSRCMMCDDGSTNSTQRISRAIDKSCCETRYAADRNKTEFLQTGSHFLDVAKLVITIPARIVQLPVISNELFANADGSSPPVTTDIPILVSSLLI